MGMTDAGKTAREILKEARDKMETGGQYGPYATMMVSLSIDEVKYLLELSDEQADWETAYNAGFSYGYQTAIKDMAKKLKGMRWYGGGYKTVRAGEVPERAGRAEKSVQPEV